MTTCADKDKQNSIAYDINGNEKTWRMHGMVMFVSMNVVNYSALQP